MKLNLEHPTRNMTPPDAERMAEILAMEANHTLEEWLDLKIDELGATGWWPSDSDL